MVNWYEAVAFCRWLSEIRGEDIRLPTEEEWERAARGTKGLEFPWGNDYVDGYANTDSESSQIRQTSTVGIYPQGKSPDYVLDMAGNVWEWCLNKEEKPKVITVDDSNDWRVLRGGSWAHLRVSARCAYRLALHPRGRDDFCGFRIVRPVPPLITDH
jgi:formylglycine-generating enzyme required for sulfatase activity